MIRKPFLPASTPGGVNHYWEEEDDGTVRIVSEQDATPVVDMAKAMRGHNDGFNKARDLKRVAFVPEIVRQKIINEEGWDPYRPDLYPEKFAALMNNADYTHLRTADGRIGIVGGRIR